jgi:hypothetical protein
MTIMKVAYLRCFHFFLSTKGFEGHLMFCIAHDYHFIHCPHMGTSCVRIQINYVKIKESIVFWRE